MKKVLIIFALAITFLNPANLAQAETTGIFPEIKQSLSVEQAYKYTHVEQVDFSRSRSNLTQEDIGYLTELFKVTDFLVIERVANQMLLQKSKSITLFNYNTGLDKLRNITPPPALAEAHKKIISAVEDQIKYLDVLNTTKGQFNQMHPYVQASNAALMAAYRIMAEEYSEEEARNLYSFEKHLCALDFI